MAMLERSTTGLATIALVLLLLAGCGDSKRGSDTQTSSSNGEIVSASALRAGVAKKATPVYWAGEQGGTDLELSRPSDDRTYVRYLTGGAEAGDERASFLTVGTYAQPNAVTALRRQAKRSGSKLGVAPGNATVYYDEANPQSVYVAYPGVPVEIEVYDPNFQRALRLVNSGQIVAVG